MHLLRDFDPDELAINFDSCHMTNEGTLTAWRTNVRCAMSHITTFWADHPQFESGNLTPALMTDELAKDLVTYRSEATAAGWTADQQT